MKHQILCLLAALSVVISLPAKPSGHLAHAAAQNTAVQLSAAAPHDTQSLKKRVKELLDNEIFERTLVGIYIYDLTDDRPVFMHNERQCMRPASNEKIVTAVTALRRLGTDYLLGTELYARPADEEGTAQLWIRGGYDPLFGAEDMQAFMQKLQEIGVTKVDGAIGLDLTMKDSKQWGWGWCWDDDEVPLTPLLYDNKDNFVSELGKAMNEAGFEWNGFTREEKVPADAEQVCRRTHTIDQLLLPMMKRSDNSMAEALFYQIAASDSIPRAGRKQAVRHVENLIRELGLDPAHYQIADGSGLSLYNYLSPELLGHLLRYAYSHEHIYNHLLPSMPVAGEDGTLRKRMKGTAAEGNVRAKTGTVEGVSTLSGYCTTAEGHLLCFSIMNQGIRRTSTGRNFQDRVCVALCE